MNYEIIFYSLLSVFLISLVSLIGIIYFSIKTKKLKRFLIYLVSFSAGALLGNAFLHLMPEMFKDGFSLSSSLYLIGGITIFFILEKFIHWRHCHEDITKENHVHPFAYTNLIGDGIHNLLDGMIVAASYIVSIPTGIATTLAVILHEIPQEIGDFGVLMHAGFSKTKALLFNFASALLALIGALLVFVTNNLTGLSSFLIPIAAGSFIYIANSDLIPEIHKRSENLKTGILQLISFLLGIGIMIAILFLE